MRSTHGRELAYRCRQCGRLCARPDGCADPRCMKRRRLATLGIRAMLDGYTLGPGGLLYRVASGETTL